jgi:hypothetical protein
MATITIKIPAKVKGTGTIELLDKESANYCAAFVIRQKVVLD